MKKLLYIRLAEQMRYKEGDALRMINNAGGIEELYSADNTMSARLEDNRDAAGKILAECRAKDISIMTIEDEGYPRALKALSDPPLVLYYKGKWKDLSQGLSIAMVGQRKASASGRLSSERFAFELAKEGVNIISGLAAGIDGAAHRGALKAGGYTVGVLGTGLDVYYPVENAGLTRTMFREGLVISEFPPGTGGKPHNFPKRNRIVAALAKGTFVVEAQLKSGSLITARLAREQGRDVFALMGQSEGCLSLIAKNLAIPVNDAGDIMNHYAPKSVPKAQPEEAELSYLETEILKMLALGKSKEEIALLLEQDISRVTRRINMLEIKGYIVKTGYSKYEIRKGC